VVTEEVQDAQLLSIDNPFDYWVLDSRVCFHTRVVLESFENYVARDFGNVYLADGIKLDFVGMRNFCIRVKSDSV
jgi:hypothetical protein